MPINYNDLEKLAEEKVELERRLAEIRVRIKALLDLPDRYDNPFIKVDWEAIRRIARR